MSDRVRELLKTVQAEKAELEKTVTPLREEYDSICDRMADLERQRREVAAKKKKYLPRLAELCNEEGKLAKALGGRALSDRRR